MGDKRKYKSSKGKPSIKASNKSTSRRIRSIKTASPTTFLPSNYNETTSTPTSPPLVSTNSNSKPLPLLPSLESHSRLEPKISSENLSSSRNCTEYPQIDHETEKLELSKLFEPEEVKSGSGRGRQGRNRDVKLLWCSQVNDDLLKDLNDWSLITWGSELPSYNSTNHLEEKSEREKERRGREWSKALERMRL